MAFYEGVVYVMRYTTKNTEYYEINGSKYPRRSMKRTEAGIVKDFFGQVEAVKVDTATTAARNAVHVELRLESIGAGLYKGRPGVNVNHVWSKVVNAVEADNESYQ
jgi:hypothetical protein